MGVWKKRNVKKRGKKPKHKSRKDLISEVPEIVLVVDSTWSSIKFKSSYYALFWKRLLTIDGLTAL